MKKKITLLSLLAVLFLVTLPSAVFAADAYPADGTTFDVSTADLDAIIYIDAGYTVTLTGSNASNNARVRLLEGSHVILDGLSLNTLPSGYYGISMSGTAQITLAASSSNNIRAGANQPAILYGLGNTLTIDGSGSLRAVGGSNAAGIGSYAGIAGGTLTINDGTIMTNGGTNGAGIGGGNLSNGGTVIINGGDITAIGGSNAAGIGSGSDSTGISIQINGGVVVAEGGSNAAGLGGGWSSPGGNIEINGGNVRAAGSGDGTAQDIGSGNSDVSATTTISGSAAVFLSYDRVEGLASTTLNHERGTLIFGNNLVGAIDIYSLTNVPEEWETMSIGGYFVPPVTPTAIAVNGGDYNLELVPSNYIVNIYNNVTLYGTNTTNDARLVLHDGSTATFDGVSLFGYPAGYTAIDVAPGASASIVTSNGSLNNVSTGEGADAINVATGETLTLSGSGTLNVDGNTVAGPSCAIGSNAGCGTIIINGGTINANSGLGAPAIGGHDANITINDGTVTAACVGNPHAAAIGSGQNSASQPVITINGGTVHATSGLQSSAIGGGEFCYRATVNIAGGLVYASGATGWGHDIGSGNFVTVPAATDLSVVTISHAAEVFLENDDISPATLVTDHVHEPGTNVIGSLVGVGTAYNFTSPAGWEVSATGGYFIDRATATAVDPDIAVNPQTGDTANYFLLYILSANLLIAFVIAVILIRRRVII